MVRYLFFIVLLVFVTGCATQQSNDLVEKSPKEKKAELYYDYGTSALVKQEYTKALTNLQKAVEVIDDNSHFHNNLGMAYFFKGDRKSAVKHLNISIDLDEKNSDAKNNLASVYFHMGNFAKAKKIYEEVIKDLVYSKQFRVYYNLGLIYEKFNRKDKAAEMFKKSISENKSYCPAHYKLGEMAQQNHNYYQAATHFENAYSGTCNKNPSPYLLEARSLQSLGEYGKALMKYENIVEKFPKSKEAILARRNIKQIKINELRKDKQQAKQYEIEKMRKALEKSRRPKETEEKKVESLQF